MTNGSLLRAFVKTGPNEMTLSDTISWTDDTVLQGLAGLTFAAVDDSQLRDIPGQGPRLVNLLCPPADRVVDWTLPPSQTQTQRGVRDHTTQRAPPALDATLPASPPVPFQPQLDADALLAGAPAPLVIPVTGSQDVAADHGTHETLVTNAGERYNLRHPRRIYVPYVRRGDKKKKQKKN